MKCLDGSNNVKVYNLTANKIVPEWQSNKKKRKKPKRDEEELLQDFEMPDVSNCMKLSPDGQYLVACGTYKPVMKCYDLEELSVKFERGMDAEVLCLEVLSEDYSKVAFLQEDRYLELHGQGGRIDRLRVPKFGRHLSFNPFSAELYIATSGNEVYRLNLFQGRFLNSFDCTTNGINRLSFNKHHGLLMCGTDDGVLQVWDPRMRTKAAMLDCGKHMLEHDDSLGEQIKSTRNFRITALEHNGPVTYAVGSETGQILVYDIRTCRPHLVRDHNVRKPIKALHFHSSGNIFSMAPGVVKIWDKDTGAAVTSIEGDSPFNDMAVVPGTGISFFACEDKRMKAYFVPSLGPAPSWCAHLDQMTEELEEYERDPSVATQFDDYTFVTAEDLAELGLRDLIGTSMLHPVMHGYYINNTVYNKAKQLTNPVKALNVIRRKVKETIAEEYTIKIKEKKPAEVQNQDVLASLASEYSAEAVDDRVAKLFTAHKFKRDLNEVQSSDRTRCLSKNKNRQEAFKKRMQEIEREEEEEECEPEQVGDAGEASDDDSVLHFVLKDYKDKDSPEELERQEQMRKMFRDRNSGKRRKR